MAEPVPIDRLWLGAHPLPMPDERTDKNARGRVGIIGGSALVPGGVQLTAEAALRAGAGKVHVATIASAALALGIAMPEVAVTGLSETAQGEIAVSGGIPERLTKCDALVLGPAMSCGEAGGQLVDELIKLDAQQLTMVIDAAALMTLASRSSAIEAAEWPAILTPHIGEMAAMMACDAEEIHANREAAARRAADRYGAIVVLKGTSTLIADPTGELAIYPGGGPGLATSGSGDVLAGIIAGLAARGAAPWCAACWGVWLHGEAGRRAAERVGRIGFLARDLTREIPGLISALV